MSWPRGLTALTLSENISRAFAPGMVQEEMQGADLHITQHSLFPIPPTAQPGSCHDLRVTACTLPGHTTTDAANFSPAKTFPSPCCKKCWCLKAGISLGKFGRPPQQGWQTLPQCNTNFTSASPSHCFWEIHRKKLTGKKSVILKTKISGLWGYRF